MLGCSVTDKRDTVVANAVHPKEKEKENWRLKIETLT